MEQFTCFELLTFPTILQFYLVSELSNPSFFIFIKCRVTYNVSFCYGIGTKKSELLDREVSDLFVQMNRKKLKWLIANLQAQNAFANEGVNINTSLDNFATQ